MQVEGDAFILHIVGYSLCLHVDSLIASEGRPLGELIDSTLSLLF